MDILDHIEIIRERKISKGFIKKSKDGIMRLHKKPDFI
jgi:hypothetical protein